MFSITGKNWRFQLTDNMEACVTVVFQTCTHLGFLLLIMQPSSAPKTDRLKSGNKPWILTRPRLGLCHARVLGLENVYNRGGNNAVPGLLLSSILIAAPLKGRRVPLTVQILISVIAFQSRRSTSRAGHAAACHPLHDRRHAPMETVECWGR